MSVIFAGLNSFLSLSQISNIPIYGLFASSWVSWILFVSIYFQLGYITKISISLLFYSLSLADTGHCFSPPCSWSNMHSLMWYHTLHSSAKKVGPGLTFHFYAQILHLSHLVIHWWIIGSLVVLRCYLEHSIFHLSIATALIPYMDKLWSVTHIATCP